MAEIIKRDIVPVSRKNSFIDEGLYSRQLYVLGHNAMKKMSTSDVLICGAKGLGIEVAKNIILAGVRSVTLHDVNPCKIKDLSSQYYLKETDLGKNRAERSVKHLQDLNSYVSVEAHTEDLTLDFIKRFTVVVLTDSTLKEKCEFGNTTHKNDISLVVADTKGLFGQVFCDFGKSFVSYDSKGENPVKVMIESITKDVKSVVTCVEKRHGFDDGDYVTFSEVQGMTELNGCKPRKIEIIGPCSFTIGDTSKMSEYLKGGMATQVIMPKTITFNSFAESIRSPSFVLSDFAKKDRLPQLHLGFQGVNEFAEKYGRLPKPWNKDDATNLISIVEGLNKENPKPIELNYSLIRKLSYVSEGDLCPMQSVIGGIAAQECLKSCGQTFHPICQWFYFDALECLSKDELVKEESAKPQGRRYDGQIAVFGKDMQEKISNLKYFVVGSGAIGCEYLKNFAMMGLASGKDGKIIVTDMDRVERSNLNRQLLFRSSDIGKWKSEVAERAIREMNTAIHVESHKYRVSGETEVVYDEDFYEHLDGVANALDNIDARLYMDEQSVFHRKPLLESGTHGTKGNVQVILPFITESYASSTDPPDKLIPICTLKVFPNTIEHTLQWAREEFENIFKVQPENGRHYLKNPMFVKDIFKLDDLGALEMMKMVKKVLLEERPRSFDECVNWARLRWEDQFVNEINQLLQSCPPDYVMKSGVPFWSGPKRCPKPLKFDAKNYLHLDYIVAASNLRAHIYGLTRSVSRKHVANVAENVAVPEFKLKPLTADNEECSDDDESISTQMLKNITLELHQKLPDADDIVIEPIEFEKDDDSNFHMDFIVAASNLRASNYGIVPANRFKSKQIAGRIIPAIATTVAVVAGLACLELYKVAQGHATTESFRNSFFNLALPFFSQAEPLAARKLKFHDKEFSLWDRFEVQGDITLKDFLNYFRKEHQLEITLLCQSCWRLYSYNLPDPEKSNRLGMSLCDLVQSVMKKPIEPHVKALVFQLCCDDLEGNDVEVPYVKYRIPPNKKDLVLNMVAPNM